MTALVKPTTDDALDRQLYIHTSSASLLRFMLLRNKRCPNAEVWGKEQLQSLKMSTGLMLKRIATLINETPSQVQSDNDVSPHACQNELLSRLFILQAAMDAIFEILT